MVGNGLTLRVGGIELPHNRTNRLVLSDSEHGGKFRSEGRIVSFGIGRKKNPKSDTEMTLIFYT